MLEPFHLATHMLIKIQGDLKTKDQESFEQYISQPLRNYLSIRIKEEYNFLPIEVDNILQDVFKKFIKQMNRVDLTESTLNVKEALLSLVRTECNLALPSDTNRKKNLGLTRSEYKAMIKKLQSGDESLIEKVYLSHFKKCLKYLMFECGSSYDDAYSSAMEALLEIRKDLLKEKIFYGNLAYYFTKRAKTKLFTKNLKRKEPTIPLDDLDIETDDNVERNLVGSELKSILKKALDQLGDECRQVIKLYYYEELTFKEISIRINKTHEATRKQATRCRDKLRSLLGKDFYTQFGSYFEKE